MLAKTFNVHSSLSTTRLFGLFFKNPVGLGAGFDKNAKYLDVLETLGFGFIEIGTVTPKAQTGNDKPRLFRLPKDKALINRMGFNNDGVEMVTQRLKKWRERNNKQLTISNKQMAKTSFTIHQCLLVAILVKIKARQMKKRGKIMRYALKNCIRMLIILL